MPCATPLLSSPVLRRAAAPPPNPDTRLPRARLPSRSVASAAARLPALTRRPPPPPFAARRTCWAPLPPALLRDDGLRAAGLPHASRREPGRDLAPGPLAGWPGYRRPRLGGRGSSAGGAAQADLGKMLLEQAIAARPPRLVPRRVESFRPDGKASAWSRDEGEASLRAFDGRTDLEFERVTKLRSGDELYMTAVLPRASRHHRLMREMDLEVQGAIAGQWDAANDSANARRSSAAKERRLSPANGQGAGEGATDVVDKIGIMPELQLHDLPGGGGTVGLDAFLGLHDGAGEATSPGEPSCDSPASPVELQKKRPQAKCAPRCITAPTSMPVATADFDLAQRCLDSGRCFLLMPPPLCALAPVLLVANTYLRDGHRDHRVLILCIGLSKLQVEAVAAYAKSFLAGTGTSIEFVDGKNGDGLSKLPGVVVAVGSTCLGPDDLDSFSYVAVLVSTQTTTTVDGDVREQVEKIRRLNGGSASFSVIFAIYPECAELPAMAPWLEVARQAFNVTSVVLQNSLTDDESVRSRTDFLSKVFVVLPKAPQEALEVFEEAAFPLLRALKSEPGSDVPLTLLSADMLDLHRRLQASRADQSSKAARERMQTLILLNTQKRALVYCLDECIQRGLDFLTEASSRYPNDQLKKCVAGLDAIQRRCSGESAALIHHRVARVRSLVEAEREKMIGECQAAKALRMQKAFRPLVIADSSSAVDCILRSIPSAVEVDKLESLRAEESISSSPGSYVCVAHCDQLESSASNYSAALNYFLQFSHVIYLASVSGSANAPLPAIQLGHAGRLRFVGVHVDVTGTRDEQAQAARRTFTKLCLEARQAGGARGATDIARMQAILESLVRSDTDVAKAPDTPRLDIGIGVLARHDVNWIAGLLFSKLSGAAPARAPPSAASVRPTLEVRVHVPPAARTQVASTRLIEAVCSYRQLLNTVSISYVLDDGGASGGSVTAAGDHDVFRPRKRVRSA